MNLKTSALQNLIEEQLGSIPDLRFRRMFGGYGLYAAEFFFGIIHGEKLYFYTSVESQKRYEDAGMTCFITPGRQKAIKRYFEVPSAVIENHKELSRWAREAIDSAQSKTE